MGAQERFEPHETRETMHSREFLLQQGLKSAYRTAAFIGLSMVGSVLVYAVIVEVIRAQYAPFGGFSPLPEITVLRAVLAGVAVVMFFVIRLVIKLFLSGKIPGSGAGGPSGPLPAEAQRLVSAAMVTYALCETPAVFGLVLFLINGNPFDFYGFMALSLLYFAVYFPRFSAWVAWMQEQERRGGVKNA